MFPIYSTVQNDNERLANAYLKTVAAIAVLTAPPLAVIAVCSDIVIAGLYGEKWIEAAPILSLLSISGIFVCVFHLAGALVEATNHVIDEIRQQIIYLFIVVSGFILAAQYGLLAVAWVFLFGVLYLYFAMGNLALLIIKKNWGLYLKAQLPGYSIAAILSLLIWLCLPALDLFAVNAYPIRLVLIISMSGALYLGALFITPDAWLFGAKGMLREKILRKKQPA
jgi:O-antigen/teichoic acid export membrane protein